MEEEDRLREEGRQAGRQGMAPPPPLVARRKAGWQRGVAEHTAVTEAAVVTTLWL